ncbi:GNAT family N-acetyltransferase [Corynebacterium suedekumii]|nr:GNAT family N-acetyltransferase [Corynebacterium suedekumii]
MGTSLERKGGTLLLDVWRNHLRDRADLTLITLETLPPEEGLTVINDLQPGEDRLWDILADADIFCLPSLIDQAPNAILEAMAAGLPVVAHPNGAIPEMVIDGETGLLVDAHHPGPVAEALTRLVDDPQLRARMGGGRTPARQRALRHGRLGGDDPRRTGAGGGPARGPGARDGVQCAPRGRRRAARPVAGAGGPVFHPFLVAPSYALNWFRTLGKGRLSVATVHRDGVLVALLPLHTRSRLTVTVRRLTGHGLGTVGEALAEDDAALVALVDGLHRRRLPLALTHLPEDSPLVRALLDHGGWTLNHQLDDVCPVTVLPPGTTAADLRSGRSLKRLRSARNRAGREMGEVTSEVVQSPEHFARVWPEMVRVAAVAEAAEKEARLNLTAGVHGEFARSFLSEEADRGALRIVLLRVGGQLAALRRHDPLRWPGRGLVDAIPIPPTAICPSATSSSSTRSTPARRPVSPSSTT